MSNKTELIYRSFEDDTQTVIDCVSIKTDGHNQRVDWHLEKVESEKEYFKRKLQG